MKRTQLSLLAGAVLACLAGGTAAGATLIIGDDYNITGSGSGFALGSGVNSGINPPNTRLTGLAGPNLNYYKYSGAKLDNRHAITDNKFQVTRGQDPSVITLTAGTGGYDFSSALRTLNASPAVPSVYEFTITMGNTSWTNQRCSFGLTTEQGGVTTWDFGLQIFRTTTTEDFYTIQKRIDGASTGLAADLDGPITTTAPGTWTNGFVIFLVRVTDAGAQLYEYNSRVQVSLDGGVSWIYDTSTDAELPNGWRLDTTGRYFFWDISGYGIASYDDFTVNWISGPEASSTLTWSGAGVDPNWSTAANWNGTTPVTGDKLIFTGTARTVNNNDLTSLTIPWITFSNGGFELNGNPLSLSSGITNFAGTNTIGLPTAWAAASGKSWYLAPQSELRLTGLSLVDVLGNHTLYGGGALRVKGSFAVGGASSANPAMIINEGQFILDGTDFTSRGGFRIGSSSGASTNAETILTNGAVFYLNLAGGNVRVGDSSSPFTSRLVVDHSTLNMSGGSLAIPFAAGSTGEVRQVGGTVAGCVVSFNDSGAGAGSYRIKDGTLEAKQIRESTAAGISAFYFDNAILRTALAANSAFMSGIDLAEIQAGGLTLEANQADILLDQGFTGAGSLTKRGSYTVTLSGTNSYAGSTVVESGKLGLSTVQTNAAAIQVAGGAELGVVVKAPGTTITAGSLSFASGGPSTLSFDLGTFVNPSAPLMEVAGLSLATTVTVNLSGGSPAMTPGTITLIKYSGSIGGGFGLFTKGALPAGLEAQLVNNPGSIDLVITAVQTYRWTGAASQDWDTYSINWISSLTGAASSYTDGFMVEFLDGAAGGNVNVTAVAPGAMVVNNQALAYTFNYGTITTPVLRKSGAGALTRVEGGTDQIGMFELNEGSFVANNSADATFATPMTDTSAGLGSFEKASASTLTLLSTNGTFDGKIVVREGVLKLGLDGALGSTNGSTTVSNGASLDLNDMIVPHEPVIVSGGGYLGQGAIIDSTTATGVKHNLTDVTMMGDTTLGSPNGGRWDIRVRSGSGVGPGLRANGFNLTKVGPGGVSIACQRHNYGAGVPVPYWQMNLGNVVIDQGSLTFAESLNLGNPLKTITINASASMGMFDLGWSNPIVRSILMSNASVTSGGNSGHTNVLEGPLQITGGNTLFANQATLVLNGSVTGSGSLSIYASSPGTLLMNGVNNYPGDTTVTNGTFGGNGTIAGNLIMLGGTNSPGWGVGTLTVNGSVTLAGTTLMELAPGQTPNSDKLVVGGALGFAGELKVVIATGASTPKPGDVYQLFSKAGAGGFANVTLPSLPAGLTWNTNDLAVGGSIAVAGSLTKPAIGNVSQVGENLVFGGTGGVEGATYYVLTSTNVAASAGQWQPIATNVFDPDGTFSVTNAITPGSPAAFFRLQLP